MMTSLYCFSYKTCRRQPSALKLRRSIIHLKFYTICKFENHVTRNDVIMMSLSKTMKDNGKEWTSSEPNKVYIVRKVLMRAIQNVISIELSHCVKRCGHLCQIYQNHSPNMVMSRDPGFTFRKFLFFA